MIEIIEVPKTTTQTEQVRCQVLPCPNLQRSYSGAMGTHYVCAVCGRDDFEAMDPAPVYD